LHIIQEEEKQDIHFAKSLLSLLENARLNLNTHFVQLLLEVGHDALGPVVRPDNSFA
jgi:hypothetical protein